jgi:lambda family phage portal protein
MEDSKIIQSINEIEKKGLVGKFVSNYLQKNDATPVSNDDLKFYKDFLKNKNQKFYEAGRYNNTKSFWNFQPSPEDKDIYESLRQVRASSRNLAQNNSVMNKFLEMCETNIAGHQGMDLQVIGEDANGHLDIAGNKTVKKAWHDWCNSKYCDITGKLTFKEITRVIARTIPKDGEVLLRKIRQKATPKNPWGFSIQLLDVDRLDITYNTVLKNSNIVKMGIEMDMYGRPVAYHLRMPTRENNNVYANTYDTSDRERVSADDIEHIFDIINAEQTRGVPWAHAVMTLMSDLEDFLRACLIASKIGASSSIYLERDNINSSMSAEDMADMTNSLNEFVMEVSPGDIRVLPPGLKMSSFIAQYPSANFNSYVETMLKLIASGLNVTYFTLANNLSNVNYTSSRTGLLEERDNWMKKQDLLINGLVKPIFYEWLETSLLNGAIKFPNGMTMSATKFDKFKNIKVIGRRWLWVDPLKDVQASILAVKNGFMSRTDILSQMGKDYEKVLQDRKAEMELEEQYGVSFDMTDTKGGLDIPLGSEDAEDGTENGSPDAIENLDPTASTTEKG